VPFKNIYKRIKIYQKSRSLLKVATLEIREVHPGMLDGASEQRSQCCQFIAICNIFIPFITLYYIAHLLHFLLLRGGNQDLFFYLSQFL